MSRYWSNSYSFPDSMALDPTTAFSLAGWVYLTSIGGYQDLLFLNITGGSGLSVAAYMGIEPSTAELNWGCGDGTNVLTHTEPITGGVWYHMALTYDGATARAYLDGSEVDSVGSMTLGSAFTYGLMGEYAGVSSHQSGQVKVWEGVALSPSDIAEEIAFWTPQTHLANLYAWWQLDTNVGATVDSSGNGHTLSGTAGIDGFSPVPGAYARIIAAGGAAGAGAAAVSSNLGAASGSGIVSGTAAVSMMAAVAASGGSVGRGRANVSTTAITRSGQSSVGGRSRYRRRAR